MDNVTLNQLKIIHKSASFNNTLYAYVSAITNMFLRSPSKLRETCDALGLSEQELLDILRTPSLSTVNLLDEIMDLNTPKSNDLDRIKGR